jgi:hypothetical protein
MKLGQPILPLSPESSYDAALNRMLYDFFRLLVVKVNDMSSGFITAQDTAMASAPSSGTWKKGDLVRNSSPSELGTAPNKYVILGWMRITDGSANVLNTDWVACRCLTGN